MLAFWEFMIINLFWHIWQVILFHLLLNLKNVSANFLCISLVHCYLVAWYFVPFGFVYWTNPTPTESSFKCIGSTISTLEDFNWLQRLYAVGSNEQPYRKWFLKVNLSVTFSSCFHVLSWNGFVISSLSTGTSGLVNVLWRGNHSLLSPLMLATLRPSNAIELLVNSPFNLLIVSEVVLPDIARSFASWSNMNVPWLQLSRRP